MKMIKRLFLIASLLPATAFGGAFFDQITTNIAAYTTQASAPSSPASGYVDTYILTSDGKFYVKNHAGTANFCPYSGAIVNADLSGSAGIANVNLASMSNGTTKCRTTSGSGVPDDCTGAQETALLSNFVGDSGSGGTAGLVPAPPSGSAAANKFLGAGGSFIVIPSGALPADVALTDFANVFSQPQSVGFNSLTVTVANDSSTGTANSHLAKYNGNAIKTATTDTQGALGVVISGGGTTGNAQIAMSGIVTCTSDTTTSAGDYAQISSSVAGDCTDTGSAIFPTSGQVLGIWRESGSSGPRTLFIFPPGTTLSNLNASNLSAGTVPNARMPNPGASALGGIESLTCSSHNWLSQISTGGAPSCSQPSFTDIASGAITAAQMLALADTKIYVGNGSNQPAAVNLSADCSLADTGAITCTKTSGTAFANSATITAASANTSSDIVLRDGSGNFSAGTITASLTGHSSLDLALTGGTMSGAIAMGANKITGLADPGSAQDAATQNYVVSNYAGLASTNTWSGQQNLGATSITQAYTNDTGMGTTTGKLAYLSAANKAKINPTSGATDVLGVVVSGGGTSGNAQIAISGQPSCTSDGSVTLGHWAQASTGTAGDCTDSGGTSWPTTGGPVMGMWIQSGTAGSNQLWVFPPQQPTSSGGGSGPRSSVWVNTANGYGSSGHSVAVHRFTTTVVNTGSDITYADSTTLGGTFTINSAGVYSATVVGSFSSGSEIGIGYNSNGATDVEVLPSANRLCMGQATSAGSGVGGCSATFIAAVNDVITAQSAETAIGTSAYFTFIITKVSN